MSANGENFINGLSDIAREKGLLEENEELIMPEWAYECWDDTELPETGKVEIENDEGEVTGKLKYKIQFITEPDGYGGVDVIYKEEWIERNKVKVSCLPVKDYIEYLEPIILDLKDGATKNLSIEDVDYLMAVLRVKVLRQEKLITEDEYLEQLNSIE